MNILWVAVTAFVLFNTVSPIRKRQKIYDIKMFSNSTRRDILNDVVGFVAGALAAESVIQIGDHIESVQYENMIEDQFQLLNNTF
jgi:hypothetical protein